MIVDRRPTVTVESVRALRGVFASTPIPMSGPTGLDASRTIDHSTDNAGAITGQAIDFDGGDPWAG